MQTTSTESDLQPRESVGFSRITVRENGTFIYQGVTFQFAGVNLGTGSPIIFRINDNGALALLASDEQQILMAQTALDRDGNLTVTFTPENSPQLAESTRDPSQDAITRLPEAGSTILQLEQSFDLTGFAVTFAVRRSGTSYTLNMWRPDDWISVADIRAGHLFIKNLDGNLSVLEAAAIEKVQDYIFTVQGAIGNEQIRIQGNS